MDKPVRIVQLLLAPAANLPGTLMTMVSVSVSTLLIKYHPEY